MISTLAYGHFSTDGYYTTEKYNLYPLYFKDSLSVTRLQYNVSTPPPRFQYADYMGYVHNDYQTAWQSSWDALMSGSIRVIGNILDSANIDPLLFSENGLLSDPLKYPYSTSDVNGVAMVSVIEWSFYSGTTYTRTKFDHLYRFYNRTRILPNSCCGCSNA